MCSANWNNKKDELPYRVEKQAYRVKEFCQAYGIGKNTFYLEKKAGRIKTFSVGRRVLVSKKSAEEWLKKGEGAK